jgi:phosphoglycolate phosphatase-like HAD superfamily hydrolase
MQSAAKTGAQALVPLLGLAALLSVLLTAATAQAQPAPQQLFPASTGVNDRFGHAVAVSGSGDTALVGTYFDDTTAGQNAGSAHAPLRNQQNALHPQED